MNPIDSGKITLTAKYLLDRYYSFLRNLKADVCSYRIDLYIVKEIALRYWRDVERLHYFHDMPLIDSKKIAGYYAHWISKLRPISAVGCGAYTAKPNMSKFINEAFATHIACGRITADFSDARRVIIDGKTLDKLLYSLKYRPVTGDMLSLFFDMAEKTAAQKP